MSETIIFDTNEIDSTRTELDITPWVSSAGIDWGDAGVVNHMAEQAVGSTSVDFTVPNRTIQIPLSLRDVGGTTFATIRSAIQAKVGLWQKQGGYIRRLLPSGGTVYADVVSASLRLAGSWLAAQNRGDVAASLTLEALPDWYGPEQTLSDHTETTAAELIFTETTASGGDFPLGDRVRIVVDEDQAQDQRGLIWGFRGVNYSSASTAALAYEAEALQALDTAAAAAKVGASGGTMVTHGTLSTNWTPVVGTNIGGTTFLTHIGSYRAWARVFTTSGTAVQARFVYDVGDLVNPAENSAVRCYDGGTFHVLDLGQIQLNRTTGTHRWQGQIQAAGDAGGENFSVDRVWLQPLDESSGVPRAPIGITPGLVTYSARSEFNTESGVITGDALAVGGTWTGAGDADDFSVAAGVATRTAVGDADNLNTGRLITASSTSAMTNLATQVSLKSSANAAASVGVLARYVDSSNFLAVTVDLSGSSAARVYVSKVIAGSATTLGQLVACMPNPNGAYVDIGVIVTAAGTYMVYGGSAGAARPLFYGFDSALATGGTLASGKVGIIDLHPSSTANTRTYDNFAAWVPLADAVVYASQSVELATTGIRREDAGGIAYGPVSIANGDLPRIPNRASGGTVEVFAKTSRGDLETTPDPAIDDLSAKVYRRPSYLQVG